MRNKVVEKTRGLIDEAEVRKASQEAALRWLGLGATPGQYMDFREAFMQGVLWAAAQRSEK